MANQQRTWTQFPLDNGLGDETYRCLNWMLSVVSNTQQALFPPAAPVVTTIGHPNAVQIVWNEVKGATSYAIFESSVQSTPPGVPITTVPANIGAASNSYLRPNITDTTTRFYFVQAISQNQRSTLSTGTAGTALSGASPTISVSQIPVNQAGVGGGVGGGGSIFGIGRRVNNL